MLCGYVGTSRSKTQNRKGIGERGRDEVEDWEGLDVKGIKGV